jgi:heme-degrading monooxygenase HmoA
MFIRIVEATVRSEEISRLEYVYSEILIPALENIKGCIFAGLLKNLEQPKQYISLTIWESESAAGDYVESGKFERNVDQVRPLLEDSSEWKIQLSRDNMIEYSPVSSNPVVKSYPVEEKESPITDEVSKGRSHLRIISFKVKEGGRKDFAEIYNSEILPELKAVEGCKYAFLVDNSENDGEMLSISIWDSLEHIRLYEDDGISDQFMSKLSHTLGDLYQWKMALDNQSSSKTFTSQDVGIDKYTLITGKKFRQ